MSTVSFICFIVLFLLLLSCLKKDADVLSPSRIFGFVWFLSVALADLKFSRLQHNWSTFSWVMLWIGIVSFYVGIFMSHVPAMQFKEYSVREIRVIIQKGVVNEKILFAGTTSFFITYCLAFVVETLAFGGLPMFSAYPDRARTSFGLFGFHLFISGGMPVVLILVAEYYILIRGNSTKKIILAVEFLVTFITHALLLVRYTYMVFIFIGIGIAYYASRLIKIRNLLIFLSVIAFAFTAMIQVREARYVQHYLYVVSQMKIPLSYAWVTAPYMYITMNLENFARSVDQMQYFTYGYNTFDFIWALTGLKHWMAQYFGIGINEYLNSGYNTFPFFFYFFQDFGVIGLFVISTFSGFVTGTVYHWMRRSATITAIVMYACCVYLMSISFFNNSASYLNFHFTLVSLAGVHILMQLHIGVNKAQ